MDVFGRVSSEYRKKARVQQSAASRLIDLLDVGSGDRVIDVGCGPGHLTDRLRTLTGNPVVGTDISPAMIDQARDRFPGLTFRCLAAEQLDYTDQFDVVFCNSAFIWFKQPERALGAIRRALKSGGRLGIANPATAQWSPWFLRILSTVSNRPDIRETFSHWTSPWFVLPTAEAYQELFERCGFQTRHLQIERESSDISIEQAYDLYLSGPANGYISPEFYPCPLDDDYVERFNRYVREAIEQEGANGRVNAVFNRLYYVGIKPSGA